MDERGEARYGTVGDWMTREPMTVSDESPIGVALARMQSAAVRHLLVMDGRRLTGIVSNRDVRRLVSRDLRSPLLSEPVSAIMTEDPVTVSPDTPVIAAARILLERKIGAVPVRRGEEILGIFTTSDALEALLAMVDGPDS